MFISRFWTLLLVITVTITSTVVMLARDLVNREREENAQANVYGQYDKVEVGFTLFARKRLDVLLSISGDADVQKYMTAMGRGGKSIDEYRPKLLNTLEGLNSKLDTYKADFLLAIDASGKVLVKAGEEGRENGLDLSGIRSVDAVLRGYVRDDVWQMGKNVYLMAGRPVVSGGNYIGAVFHAVQLSDALATRFSSETAQIAFYSGTVVTAIGTPKGDQVRANPPVVTKGLDKLSSDKSYTGKGRSDLQRITTPDGDFLAVYSKIKGSARLLNVGWAILLPVEPQIAVTDIYEQAGKQDVENLPWVLLIGGAFLVLILGWFWNWLESERPIAKLHKAIVALEKADIKDQLNVYKYGRNVRKIATAFNRVMDIRMKDIMSSVGGGGVNSVDSILGAKDTSSRLSSASFKFAEDLSGDVPEAPPSALEAPPADAVATGPRRPLTKPQKPLTGPQAPPVASENSASERDYFKKVHQEFVAMKKKLGEPTEQLTFERFEGTLRKNSDTLKTRYGCKSVKFNVYEKDGKASLKAIPVK